MVYGKYQLLFEILYTLYYKIDIIKAINATGILRAKKDKPTHVCVFPTNGTLEDWHNQGTDSIWTQALKSIVIEWDGGK